MKLPIGIQTFSKVREDDYLYVDKTKEALELINTYEYVFLSRPRRFGKSLFLDTLRNIFEGKREYFKGLYIEDKYDFTDTYPVIKISFSGNLRTQDGINQTLQYVLEKNQRSLGITCDKNIDMPNCFKTLLEKSFLKYQKPAVILIDEYDKPLLDNISNTDMAKTAREMLKDFYGIIKDNDEYIRFTFITGVSKFSKVSLFSGLNNLKDITLMPDFGNICGYTQNDIETTLKPLLKGVDLDELKLWYNGYNFLKDKVYNPYGILLFCDNHCEFENYWFDTATPTFLIDLMKKNSYFLPDLNKVEVGKEILNSFEIDDIDIEVLLFQAGYLTIKGVITSPMGGTSYSLVIPNKEVRLSLNSAILGMFIKNPSQKLKEQIKGYNALNDAKLDEFKDILYALFASIPYENFTHSKMQNYEGFYASVIYAYLASFGLPVTTEQSTNKGRLDMSLLLNSNRYIFEFKVGDENALKQIQKMKYYEPYQNENSNIYLVGINFDENEKNISEFKWEKM